MTTDHAKEIRSNEGEAYYRALHVFDPIHNGADECECGLTADAGIHESDAAYEERMQPRITNAPERIWLQVGCDDEVGEIDWKELSHAEVSWCSEKIDNTDIEYVRADLLTAVRSALMDKLKELRNEAEALIGKSTRHSNARRRASITLQAYNKAIAALEASTSEGRSSDE
jgi:SpoVK/Ycf46/Vps4 family AAA+-type ATPase